MKMKHLYFNKIWKLVVRVYYYALTRKCLNMPTPRVTENVCVRVCICPHQASQFGMVSSLVSWAFNLRRLSSSLLIVRLEGGKTALRNNSCARTILAWPHTHRHTDTRRHTRTYRYTWHEGTNIPNTYTLQLTLIIVHIHMLFITQRC